MQLITAIIKPFKLDEVKDALRSAGVGGMTVTEVRGMGRQGGHTEVYRGAEYAIAFLPKMRIEILADEADVQRFIDVIARTATTGAIGDGKLWTTAVGHAQRLRTGEVGPDAL